MFVCLKLLDGNQGLFYFKPVFVNQTRPTLPAWLPLLLIDTSGVCHPLPHHGGCQWVFVACPPPPFAPHWDAVTLIKERDGAPARMAPLYNVMGGSQDGSAGGGNTASVSRGGGDSQGVEPAPPFPILPGSP